ncbi:MAG: alpha/beta hydrolase [Verrucomicrobiales bacterium]|nr:alpha/beta hydrolase [Verrucomicrobiales bacterium]
MNRIYIPVKPFFLLSLALFVHGYAYSQDTRTDDAPVDRLAEILERFPASDANGDGLLDRVEAAAFFRKRREGMNGTPPGKKKPSLPAPSFAEVKYGEHEKQAFDLWLVPGATEPTPLILFIHGGGFRSGDKSLVAPSFLEKCLEAGVAFAAINYRLSDVGPYPMMMEDCARGLQTIRHRASEWNLDTEKVAAYGGSAGAGISLWLGFHEDLANEESEDPVSRESTRVVAVATMNGQSTYDLNDFREWFEVPDLQPGPALPAFYDVQSDSDWGSERVTQLMKDASSINHLTKDDVPVYMMYSRPNTTVSVETGSSEWVHHVKLGLKLQEAMHELGLECTVTAPDVVPKEDRYGSFEEFLLQKVKE